MTSFIQNEVAPRKGGSAVLADPPRRVLPYPVRQLSRRYGLPLATATIVAHAAGYVLESGR
jgi:hypothetical protein